jgi:hypothetical protein
MRYALLAFALLAIPARSECGPITYNLRDARFFGGAPGPTRELNDSGSFTPATSETLATTYSTGGANPVEFTGTASTQGSPLELRAANTVTAASATALQYNASPFGPTNIVTLVQSGLQETGVFVTGGTGVGYLLPHFEIEGTFEDAHASAYGQLGICAGNNSCALTGLGNSTGGLQAVSTTYTPAIGAQTQFTFDVPFTFFFFLSSGISSQMNGTLGAGALEADFGLRFLGFSVVDINGNDLRGVVVHSDLAPVPEPASGALLLLGFAALRRWARR